MLGSNRGDKVGEERRFEEDEEEGMTKRPVTGSTKELHFPPPIFPPAAVGDGDRGITFPPFPPSLPDEV